MGISASAASNLADHMAQLQFAGSLLQQGKRDEAISRLRALVAAAPKLAHAHRLLGVALEETGDLLGAETAFRKALAAQPDLLAAAVGLAEVLLNADRGAEAIEILAPLVSEQTSDLSLLTYYASALQSVGRFDEALIWLHKGVATSPASAVAEHNLAGALGDARRFAESESAARRAFTKGLDAPETWLVLARALSAQNRPAEAEGIYREALRRRPGYADALGDLAKLEWTRTADAELSLAVIEEAIVGQPRTPALLLHRAKIIEYAGDLAGAQETLAQALAIADDPFLHVAAAQLAVRSDPQRGLEHAQRAFALRPDNYSVISTLCQARLAVGRPDEAAPLAELLCERQDWDQYALALLSTAWRLLGDPRYGDLYDYDRVVGSFRLDTPDGWPSLEAFLADMKQALEPLHPFRGHPIGQSVRGGLADQAGSHPRRRPGDSSLLSGHRRTHSPLHRRSGNGRRSPSQADHRRLPNERDLVGEIAAERFSRRSHPSPRLAIVGLLHRLAGRRRARPGRVAQVRRARHPDHAGAWSRTVRQAGGGPTHPLPLLHVARNGAIQWRRTPAQCRFRSASGLSSK
jgi:tetratricopeptide (TPR) repeat protein